MRQRVIGKLLGSISVVLIQSLTRKYRKSREKGVFKSIKTLATPAVKWTVSLVGSGRLGLPGTQEPARGARGTVWMQGKRLHCCPSCKCCRVFTLWQRISKLTQEHQNFLPVLFFPLGLLGLTVRNPSDFPWSWRWQLRLVQTVLNCERSGLPCRASTRAVTRTVSWKAAATAATRESRGRTPTSCLWRISYRSLCLGHHHFGNHRVTARWSLRNVLLNTSQQGCRIKASFWQAAQKSPLVMETIL